MERKQITEIYTNGFFDPRNPPFIYVYWGSFFEYFFWVGIHFELWRNAFTADDIRYS